MAATSASKPTAAGPGLSEAVFAGDAPRVQLLLQDAAQRQLLLDTPALYRPLFDLMAPRPSSCRPAPPSEGTTYKGRALLPLGLPSLPFGLDRFDKCFDVVDGGRVVLAVPWVARLLPLRYRTVPEEDGRLRLLYDIAPDGAASHILQGLIFGGLVDELRPVDAEGRVLAGRGVRYGWLPFMDFVLVRDLPSV